MLAKQEPSHGRSSIRYPSACPAVLISKDAQETDISHDIDEELENVAVCVKSLRSDVTLAAQSLLMVDTRPLYFPPSGSGGQGVLGPCAWIAGEYAEYLNNADGVLGSLIHETSLDLPSSTLAVFVYAALKVVASICNQSEAS
jgi:AP-3 complex subunit delta-1